MPRALRRVMDGEHLICRMRRSMRRFRGWVDTSRIASGRSERFSGASYLVGRSSSPVSRRPSEPVLLDPHRDRSAGARSCAPTIKRPRPVQSGQPKLWRTLSAGLDSGMCRSLHPGAPPSRWRRRVRHFERESYGAHPGDAGRGLRKPNARPPGRRSYKHCYSRRPRWVRVVLASCSSARRAS